MTTCEPTTLPLSPDPYQTHAPRKRRSSQTYNGSARSPTTTTASNPRTTISKRSPSPRVAFTPSSLPADKGVGGVARKVIRRLENLGHLDPEDMADQEDIEERDEQEQVVDALVPNGHVVEPEATSESQLKKIDWEIPRKVLHSSIGFFTLYLYVSRGSPRVVTVVLWSALAVIAPTDFLRMRYPTIERTYERYLGFLMRESEKHSSNGVIWYILGVNFALTVYPLDVATVAILILSWADTAASTIGRLWGSYTPPLPAHTPVLHLPLAPRKSLAGFLAASVTGAAIVFGFWGWIAPIRSELSWTLADGVRGSSENGLGGLAGWIGLTVIGALAGLASGVAEALDLGSLDDNLTLPIISGGCILGMFKLIGLLS